ncbi:FAD-dependent oxidoreductase [Streptomyces fulvoviolaceus]|uniref:FAD-dependent oxidoreductase n=1 Tax=Streptomyces fulvoviolaceus TaxID=285535 RepID=UPI0021C11F56|nr:FAD-dependent oxidoreductase [Streptomyces fulvoviolaceus]MCT9080457.1 FAD-binding oxidoreductase [Streptomyces fulvoviolaceus]
MTTNETIVVVGGGVSGLTTGVVLLEAGLPVRLVAEEIPGRTSLAAGAMWGPYLVEPWAKVREWSLASLGIFRQLAEEGGAGVRMVSGVEAARHHVEIPSWSELLPDFREADSSELPDGFVSGHRFNVPLVDMPVYLDYLGRRFCDLGGEVEQRTVRSLDEVTDASAVVNCAGMGAAGLAEDTALRPIRGQHVVVENPGITEFFSEDTGLSPDLVCFYPHGDTVVLGGTAIDGDADLSDDAAAAKRIIERCAAVEPRLADARVIGHRVGARPTRPRVRVEADRHSGGGPVIHNYGHGGAGVTLSWGCAREVSRLIADGYR